MRRPGAAQESDGSTSMRRILSAGYAIAAVTFWSLASVPGGGMPAFYSGLAASCSSLILLFFTTWTDLSATAAAIRGQGSMTLGNYPAYPDSPYQAPSGGVTSGEEPEK